jgi:hypothetical protein
MNTKATTQLKLTEYHECLLLVKYLNLLQTQGKVLLYTHIPSESYTKNWGAIMKSKRLGTNAGFPDYVIIGKTKVICIEMKRSGKGARISEEQLLWLVGLSGRGVPSYICYGFDDAKKILDQVI